MDSRCGHADVRARVGVQRPTPIQVARSLAPGRKRESETMLQQPGGNDPAALQNELGLRAHQDSADLQHPAAGWQSQRSSRGFAQDAHEVGIRQWIGSRHVHDALDLVMVDEPANGGNEVLVVNPRHELPAISSSPAEAPSSERQKRVEDAAGGSARRRRELEHDRREVRGRLQEAELHGGWGASRVEGGLENRPRPRAERHREVNRLGSTRRDDRRLPDSGCRAPGRCAAVPARS